MKKIAVVGFGIAGSSVFREMVALSKISANEDFEVTVFFKGDITDCNSILAQGGIAVALDPDDTAELHARDTYVAGQELGDTDAIDKLTRKGIDAVQNIIDDGMRFDVKENGELDFNLEGAHSKARVLHAGGDQTGKYLTSFLRRNAGSEKISLCQNAIVTKLEVESSKIQGLHYIFRNSTEWVYEAFDIVILATGGLGQLYTITSNAPSATGDGIALAKRAGAELSNMEFVQFHPTLLFAKGLTRGLVSEAVRGSGGVLVDQNGTQFMENVHPLKHLAPRDVISKEIKRQLDLGNEIYIDIQKVQNFEQHFPTVVANMDEFNVPWRETKLIPVRPGAHFLMGGIKTTTSGQTSIQGLYAVGECAESGVHGANRLASNSLLEGVTFGKLVAKAVLSDT